MTKKQLAMEELKVLREDIKEDIVEFTQLKLDACDERSTIRYGLRLAFAEDNYKIVDDKITELENIEKIKTKISKDKDNVTFEDIEQVIQLMLDYM